MGELASALMPSTLIFMAGAAFVGIAHQPLHYYLIMFAVSPQCRDGPCRGGAGPACGTASGRGFRGAPARLARPGEAPVLTSRAYARTHRMIDASASRISRTIRRSQRIARPSRITSTPRGGSTLPATSSGVPTGHARPCVSPRSPC